MQLDKLSSTYSHLITVPPSMRQSSAKQETKTQQISKFLFDQPENLETDRQNIPHTSTQSLHQLLQQKSQQLDHLQRKYLQMKQIKSRKPQGMNFMNGFLDEYVLQFKDKVDNGVISDLIALSNTMNEIYRVQQSHLQLCGQRLQVVEQLVEQLKCLKETDLFSLKKVVCQLQESFQQTQVTELDANRLYRDLQHIKLKYAKLQTQFEIIQKQNEHTEKNMQQMKNHMQHSNEEALLFKRNLRKEVSQNQFNQRRVFTLEQRLEVLSGSEYKKDKDTLRNIIDEMLKENEANKRKAFQKSQEVQKLEQAVVELKEKNQKLAKRNNLLEKQLKLMGYTSYDLNGNLIKQPPEGHTNEDEFVDVFDRPQIPTKLDFKLDPLKPKARNLVEDLIVSGTKQAIDQLQQLDQQSQIDQITIYMDLFVQYKCLSESVNILIHILRDLLQQDTIELMMSRLHSSSSQLQCESIMLWLIDQQTATFYTYNNKNELMNAYIDSDEFLNVVKSSSPIYRQQTYVYRFTETAKFAKDCYLVPLLADGRIIGLLSMENLSQKKQDAKYIGLLLSQLLIVEIQRLVQFKLINYQLRYKNLLFEAFTVLSKQRTRYSFQRRVEESAETLFGISSCRFYFVVLGALHYYTSENQFKQFSSDQGVVGFVAVNKQPLLVANIRQHHSFHQALDICSGLPILTIPLSFGVLQIVLNQSAQIHYSSSNSTIEVRKLLAPSETMQSMAKMFSEICQLAFQFIDQNNFIKNE